MKVKTNHYALFMSVLIAFSCGSGSKQPEDAPPPTSMIDEVSDPYENWQSNNGIGPITSLELPDEINQELAGKGKEIFDAKCTACHKIEKRFIGPSPKGLFDRRTPAWIMNMILNPDKMVAEDPIAKQLLIDFNGSPMANQNLTEDEARSVVEYFRTL